VSEVCKGANCVMHIASFVDTTLLPDKDRSYAVNVTGIGSLLPQAFLKVMYISNVSKVNAV